MLNSTGAFSVFKLRNLLIPIVVDQHYYFPRDGGTLRYAELYIFGIRIARWRSEKP